MQDYLFRDPVVIVKCQAYTGAVAATARDRGMYVYWWWCDRGGRGANECSHISYWAYITMYKLR